MIRTKKRKRNEMANNLYTMEQWKKDKSFNATAGQEITPEVYNEMLNTVPPKSLPHYITDTGFLMGEPHDSKNGKLRYKAFVKRGTRYYYLGLLYESETYREMKERHQSEVNALPLAFAFSEKQFKEKLAEWDLTEEDARNGSIIAIGGGGFIKACDRELVISTFERIADEEAAAVEADTDGNGYIYQMFLYELTNHEYSYTQDINETLEALNISASDLENSEALRNGLQRAIETING